MGKAIHEIADHYGLDPQLDQLTEECAELIQAVNKYRRTGDFTNLVEELADVEIMTAQVEYLLHATSEVEEIAKKKLCRQLMRIGITDSKEGHEEAD